MYNDCVKGIIIITNTTTFVSLLKSLEKKKNEKQTVYIKMLSNSPQH